MFIETHVLTCLESLSRVLIITINVMKNIANYEGTTGDFIRVLVKTTHKHPRVIFRREEGTDLRLY